MDNKQSTLTRALTHDGGARIIVANSTATVQTAHEIHNTSKTMTAAIGRVLTAASIMGSLLKDKDNTLTVQFKGDGPAGTVICVSDYSGNVRGCAGNTHAELPPNSKGKLDVGGAIGKGTMYIMKDLGLAEPYIGMSEILSGEVAEDITEYYAVSEQTPTVCSLGVRVNNDCSCKAAGGFLVQLLPFADNDLISKLERNVANLEPISSLVDKLESPLDIINRVFEGIEYDVFDELDISYKCNCSHERYLKALVSLGKKELKEMYDDGKEVECVCRFCNAKYSFSPEEILKLL